MNWNDLVKIRKFTPMENIFIKFGKPKFQLGEKLIYYMGNGYLISFSERPFLIDDEIGRTEYGEVGEYALRCTYIKTKCYLEQNYGLKQNRYELENVFDQHPFTIIDDVTTEMTLKKVKDMFRLNGKPYGEIEHRAFMDGTFTFQKKIITCDNFQFYFFGKSSNTVMGGVEFLFME